MGLSRRRCYNSSMTRTDTKTLAGRIETEFLPFVRRPSRYIGGEINQARKDLARCELTVALCFPDVYEVGMSHTGLAIIYDCLNKLTNVAAERVFAPWTDAERIMREKHIPLFSLESKAAPADFDIIGFSLTSELCYTNVLNMLDLARLQVRSDRRCESDPIIIAGGPMANCCEPLAEFVDLFLLGEGEQAAGDLIEMVRRKKNDGATKEQILLDAAKTFDCVYVPRFYAFDYDNAAVKSFKPRLPGLRTELVNAVVDDFDGASVPLRPIVPFTQAVHERVSIEIMRGCPGRCRFCQASFCRRPVRYRSPDRIVETAKAAYRATGFDTVSLLSLSSADYPHLEELTSKLNDYFRDKHVGLSLPSLRVDKHLKLLPLLVTSVRKSGLTIAVEAADERLRQVINKPLKHEDLFAAVLAAYHAGWKQLKLYFMVGLPGETQQDITKIVHLSIDLARLRRKIDGKTGQLNVTVSWMVPKPHTPFAWLEQKPKSYFETAKRLILSEKMKLGARFLQFKFHNIERSILECALARGDRRMGRVIETAWRGGARFDLWDECFDHRIWRSAFETCDMSLDSIAQKRFGLDEILPWEHLGGPAKKYLLTHLADTMEQVNKRAQ